MSALTSALVLVCTFLIQGTVAWPVNQYYVEGEKIDLKEQSVTPFKMWLSVADYSQTRFETNNGKVTVYVTEENGSKSVYMEHYAAGKNAEPYKMCSSHTDLNLVEPLPDLEDFKMTGKAIRNGKSVDVWTYFNIDGDEKIEETMHVNDETPVRFQHKEFNKKTGLLSEHYVIRYYAYSDKISEDVFEFDGSKSSITKTMETLNTKLGKRILNEIGAQGTCGSCWAFATTASIEGALSIKYKTNFDLSEHEQSIIDCGWGYKETGCDGGFADDAMQFVYDPGIATEMEYGGYLGYDGECQIKNMTRLYKLRGFVAVSPNTVNALKAAIYLHGPVAASIGSSDKMDLYSHGIFYEFPAEQVDTNHVVTVVGYGLRYGDLYWIVKNSYGQSWGEDGYVLIAAKDNTARILTEPYYPIV